MNSLLIIFFLSYGLYAFFNNFKFWIIYTIFISIYYYIIRKNESKQKNINVSNKINHSIWSNKKKRCY